HGPFTKDDERVLTIFGWYAGVCLENALMSETARRHEQLALVGRFASTVAHEMQNPLQVISGYAQIIAASAPDWREQADMICAEVERLSGMIGELMEFAHGGGEDLTVRPYGLRAFFH